MSGKLIFSSDDLASGMTVARMLQDDLIDIIERDGLDHIVITTTKSLATKQRSYRIFDPYTRDVGKFYDDLMDGELDADLELYEDEEGIYGFMKSEAGFSIIKFNFRRDINFLIEEALTSITFPFFDDARESMECLLKDFDYIEDHQSLEASIIEDLTGNTAEFGLYLPEMQNPIFSGKMFYDDTCGKWCIDEDTLEMEHAYDTYIEECLF